MGEKLWEGIPLEAALESVGPGWSDIIRAVYTLLDEDSIVTTVKEKFGGLRIYLASEPEHIIALTDLAEGVSLRTCEECGAPGKPGGKFWIKTTCKEHAL